MKFLLDKDDTDNISLGGLKKLKKNIGLYYVRILFRNLL